jgi:two-component system nitrogen regulation response regulator NtrX
MEQLHVMVVDDDELLVQSLVDMLEMQGYKASPFYSAQSAYAALEKNSKSYDIILTDINMPTMDGYSFIEKIKNKILENVKILVLTGYGSIDSAVKAIKLGADAYYEKDKDPELLLFEIKKIADQIRLQREVANLQQGGTDHSLYLFSSENPDTRTTFEMAKQIAGKDVNVLITGESGTGKEILARFIHHHSGRAGRFVSVNCSAIPDTLFESAMFGHVKGSFTGADKDKPGFFREAQGGTLLLDEVGELMPMNQAKLLKVIEEKTFFQVGSPEAQQSDCRIIAATNQDLAKKLENGDLRSDFFYRINTVPLQLLPLRERKEDILNLAEIYLRFFSRKYQTNTESIDEKGKELLMACKWSGNIRELKQVIERCVLFAVGKVIDADLVKKQMAEAPASSPSDFYDRLSKPYKKAKNAFDKLYFQNALELADNNVNEVARISGMNRTYIYQKLHELGLHP